MILELGTGLIKDMNYKKRNYTLDVNYHSNVTLIEEFKIFKKKKPISIVCISSIVGNFDLKTFFLCIIQNGFGGFIKSVNRICKKKCKDELIAPGFIKSSYYNKFVKIKRLNDWICNRTPMGDGKPDEVSNVIEFLISDKNSYIADSTIYVDGGWHVS